jgi:hypothetical protein
MNHISIFTTNSIVTDKKVPIIISLRIFMISRTFRHPPIRVADDMSIFGQMAAKMH